MTTTTALGCTCSNIGPWEEDNWDEVTPTMWLYKLPVALLEKSWCLKEWKYILNM